MRNKLSRLSFLSRAFVALLASLISGGVANTAFAAEVQTLFTTPAERQIINNNRYRNEEIKVVKPVDTGEIQAPVQQLVQEEVRQQYRVSGITISNGGSHSVWINDSIFADGDRLDDNSKIKIFHDGEIKVRITAPDGKHYFAKSGETVETSYLVPVQN